MRAIALALAVLLAGCASGPGIKESWYPDQSSWQSARKEGARLTYHDGAPSRFIPPEKIDRLVTAKERLEKVSGVKADLALFETDSPNAFALTRHDRPVIAISLSMLDALERDEDALATTIGHELAHLHLGHLGGARKQREDAVTAGAIAGTVMDMVIPFSGTLTSLAVTAYARSFSRDEERAADALGLKWAVEAGYDPCGHYRVATAFQSGLEVPFLSSHPGYGERSELASEHSLKATGKPCQ